MKRVLILGSTGSIGTQTVDVVRAENQRDPGAYTVTALSAGSSVGALLAQIAEFRPAVVAVADPAARRRGRRRFGSGGRASARAASPSRSDR